MSGIIPEDEDEEQEIYDDAESLPIDEEIYEELPGERFTKSISTLEYSHRSLGTVTIKLTILNTFCVNEN